MEAILVALMSLLLAGGGAGAWRLLARIDTTNAELARIGERVSRIEGHLFGLEIPADQPAG